MTLPHASRTCRSERLADLDYFSQETEDDDDFIPRGQSVQTAAAGGKKGGRPR